MSSDRATAAQGGRWGIVSAFFEQGGSMLATVVLARLLTPDDFGVVAAAAVILNLLTTFGQVGLAHSMLRRETVEEPIASSIFWASSGVGVVLTGICIVTAPLLAHLLKQPEITPYVIAFAPLLLINMVTNVSEATLLRDLRFRWVYVADITNIVVYVVLTIALAWAGFGAWSMVWGRVAGELLAALVRLFSARFWPKWVFSWQVIKEDARFNGHVLLSGQLSFFTKNVDYWAVSRSLGAEALGTYYVAFVLPNILRQRITWLSQELVTPLMARAQKDTERLISMLRESTQITGFVAIPLLTGVALTASELIRIAFGPQWADAVGPLRWLCLGAIFDAVTQGFTGAFIVVGKPGLFNRSNVLRLVAMVVGLVVVLQFSSNLTTIAAVVTIAGIVGRSLLFYDAKVEWGVGFLTVARWLDATIVSSVVMSAAVLAVMVPIADLGVVVRAIIEVAVGVAAFLATLVLVSRSFAKQMLNTGKELVGARRS